MPPTPSPLPRCGPPHAAADAVGVPASLQAMAATPNCLIQEYGGGTGEGLFTEPCVSRAGLWPCPRALNSG